MRDAAVGHQCPDCVAEGRRSQRPTRTAFGGGEQGASGYVTKALIAINCLVAVAAAVSASGGQALYGGGLGGLLGGTTPVHLDGALVVPWVADGEYYRLLTSMFLHYGLLHLGMNMWALWVLGRSLEVALGPLRFLALYLLSGLGGSVAIYLFTDAYAYPPTQTSGASGAIFGLFAALFVVLRRMGKDSSSVVPILLINLVITFTVPGISIAGHLGGMVTGAAVAAGLAYPPRRLRTPVQVIVCVGVLTLLCVATMVRTSMITNGVT
jgi:membrane associated rhomboid family serine protease